MIQLNLLPDVKLLYIKAQRQRRLVMGVSILVTGASVVLLLLLLSFNGLQKKHLNDLSQDIARDNRQLQNKPNVNKILTVQNQLESLTALHESKPAAGRLFSYLNQVTPASVSITTFTTDFTQGTATITGTSDSLSNVNKYVDTLKFITYTTDNGDGKAAPVFSNVVLSSFGLNTGAKDVTQAASFTITVSYDKTIFDNTEKVELTVPTAASTRSQVSQPSDLFKATPTVPTPGGNR
ncbi:MAG TPA: PilN domain-containing protein [Candidatus Saccharimonadales bacterium]|nr:PilN domain-containing protein [Candidatus Saccharimonadales bacterium]